MHAQPSFPAERNGACCESTGKQAAGGLIVLVRIHASPSIITDALDHAQRASNPLRQRYSQLQCQCTRKKRSKLKKESRESMECSFTASFAPLCLQVLPPHPAPVVSSAGNSDDALAVEHASWRSVSSHLGLGFLLLQKERAGFSNRFLLGRIYSQ